MAPKNAPKRLQGGMAPENAPDKRGDDVYRGCLDGLVIDLRSMDLDKHMHMLRKTPFRHLFEAIHNNTLESSVCRRSNGTIRKILSTYEKKTTYLKIGVEQIPISEELIRLIFGIVDGDKEIKVGKKERVRVAFIDRLYPLTKTKKDNKLTKSKIEKVLKSKGISSEDFARLAVLYILTYALAPTKGYSIGWYYTQFVEDVNSMIKYNWSSFIYDMLMVGLDKEKKGSMGCVLILAYCLCECSRIIDPLPRSPTFPRCVKWDLNELAKALKGKDIDFFFHKVRVYTKATKEEKRLLLRIEEDKENDENVNGSMKMTHASQEEIERLRVKIEEQKKLIEEQNHEIEKLKKDLESSTKRQEELMLEDGNKNEPFKAGGVHEHLEDFMIVERARENNHAEMSSVPITEAGDHDQRDDSMNRKRGRTNEQNLQAELPQSKKSFIDAGEQSDDSMRTKRAKQSEQQDYTKKMEAIDGCEIGKIKITYKRWLRKRSRTDTNGPNENGTNEEVEPCSKSKCNGETVVDQRECLTSEELRLKNLIQSFMFRMEHTLGKRKFSKWGGSVMDSIAGAYLAQNVNDVLSSSALMSLAAKFPQERVAVNSHGETSSSKQSDYKSEPVDIIDWSTIAEEATISDIIKAIKTRGMYKNLAKRIKNCLDKLVKTRGSTDMEWLRDASCDKKAREYLLGLHGLGVKSVECICLLTLEHKAFPIDTNAGRVALRLGWVPLKLLENVKVFSMKMNKIQEYLWMHLLSHVEHSILYELYCQLITFAKVFCTERNPNCSECPMRKDCDYFAAIQGSDINGDIEDFGLKTSKTRHGYGRFVSALKKEEKKKEEKNVTSSRVEHQVFVLPENHEVLGELESRAFYDNNNPYLLVVWAPENLKKVECTREENALYGTLLIPARAANRGMFPLNGTFFQDNEVFADDKSSKVPIKVPRASLVNLSCGTLYCGKSLSPICKGMTSEKVRKCFTSGYVCFRGFNVKTREPVSLSERFYHQASMARKS